MSKLVVIQSDSEYAVMILDVVGEVFGESFFSEIIIDLRGVEK